MLVSSWVELTRLCKKLEEKNTNPLRRIQLERSHLRHEKKFHVHIRTPFKYGDFTILAMKIEGKKGDSRNIRKGGDPIK